MPLLVRWYDDVLNPLLQGSGVKEESEMKEKKERGWRNKRTKEGNKPLFVGWYDDVINPLLTIRYIVGSSHYVVASGHYS